MKRSQKKTVFLLKAASSFLLKKSKLDYFPLRLWIETTSRCNLSCGLCANKDLSPDQKGDMDMGLFKKIIDEAAGLVRDVNLFHRGEPLLNENIFEMISYAKRSGIGTRLHTNATLLDEETSRMLISAGLDYISFSFDGYLKETYEKNRKGASFDDTLNNIMTFLKIKNDMGSKIPYSAIQVMEYDEKLTREDFKKQKEDFLKRFRNLGPDRLNIRKPHNWGGLINGISSPKDKMSSPCTFCWYSLTVLYDGRVCICPQDFKASLVVGDVTKTSIKKIFDSKEIRDIRHKNKNGQIAKMMPCKNCDRLYRKTFIGLPRQYLRAFILGK